MDEMLARKLSVPLEKISLSEFEPGARLTRPTYRVHAFDAAGKEILAPRVQSIHRDAAL